MSNKDGSVIFEDLKRAFRHHLRRDLLATIERHAVPRTRSDEAALNAVRAIVAFVETQLAEEFQKLKDQLEPK
jgi:hypothetical protein